MHSSPKPLSLSLLLVIVPILVACSGQPPSDTPAEPTTAALESDTPSDAGVDAGPPLPPRACVSYGSPGAIGPWIERIRLGSMSFSYSGAPEGYYDSSSRPVAITFPSVSAVLDPTYRFTAPALNWRGWADWNGDGVFDATEEVLRASSKDIVYPSFAVPGGLTPRIVRVRISMRVPSSYADRLVYAEPCSRGFSGQVADFFLDLRSGALYP